MPSSRNRIAGALQRGTAAPSRPAAAKTTAAEPPAAKSRAARAPAGRLPATPAALIDARIAELGDWRGAMLARLRALIREADPDVVETWKWRGVPVWEDQGIICTGETYKSVVKATFARGASLPDPARLFNSSLDGNVRRAIDFHEGDEPDAQALKALVRAAVALNKSSRSR
ncbi:MAG: DUF1801 domain-containing protein [Rhizobacter sp.]|nr:DUF1801 domain-containing protein [Rhizobacter sp.]